MENMFSNWSEISKTSFNSIKELGEINIKAMERVGAQQVAWFSMFADVANKQVELAGEAKTYQDLMSAQSELAADISNKALEIANNTADILNESKDQMSSWFEKMLKGANVGAVNAGVKKSAA